MKESEDDFLLNAPLLRDLDAQLESARTRRDWGIISAKRAIYLARTSRFRLAASVSADIRRIFSQWEDMEVFVWLWIAEAVLDFYQSGETRSMALLRRAHAVSRAADRRDLSQYAAAWLANSCFRDALYPEMVRWLKESGLDLAILPEARARGSMVLALALQSCAKHDHARHWFALARESGRGIGDRATLMASIENRAVMRLDRVWVEFFMTREVVDNLSDIESEFLGALAYERVTGSNAFAIQGDINKVRLHVLRSRFAEALAEIKLIAPLLNDSAFSIVRASHVLSRWLELKITPEIYTAREDIIELECAIGGFDVDDRCVCYCCLREIAIHAELFDLAARYEDCASEAYRRNAARVTELTGVLADIGY